MTSIAAPAPRPGPRPSRTGRRLRTVLGSALTYVLLIAVGLIVIFPFVFMVTTAFKTSEEVYRYPPTLLPQAPATVVVPGLDEPQPLYAIPVGDEVRQMYPAERGVEAGVFLDPADTGAEPVAWPLAEARPVVDAGGAPVTADIDGSPMPLYDLTIGGQAVQLALERETAVARFVDPTDPSLVGYAVLRTATPVESPTANPENFSEVLQRAGFDRNLTNTLLVTMAVVLGQLFTSIVGGYAFARIRFPGRDQLFLLYLGSIMVPFVVLIIPLYQLMVAIGWVDSVASLVFPWLITAYGTFLMRQFFISVPRELEEAAFVDGASRWAILWRIFVPLSLPAVATLTTFAFLYAWNSFVWPFIVISTGNTEAQVLTVALQQFGGRAQDAPQLIFAGVTIAVAVPIIAFILVQRYYVANVSTSGIK